MLTSEKAYNADVFHGETSCTNRDTVYHRRAPTRVYDGEWVIPVISESRVYTYLRQRDAHKFHVFPDGCPF